MDYKHLNINERSVISQLKSSGFYSRNCKKLERNSSTNFIELRKNNYKIGINLLVQPLLKTNLNLEKRGVAEEA